MACLCAPTTHEGSFRCRFHRTPAPAPAPAPNHRHHRAKGALVSSSVEISDPACRLRAADWASSTEANRLRCNSSLSPSAAPSSPPEPSSLPLTPARSSPPTLSLPSSPRCCPRPPSVKRAASSTPKGLPKVLQSGPAALRQKSEIARLGYPAAAAIMKQHLQHKLQTVHPRHGCALRCTAAAKIGPSRLNRMSSAHAEDDPLFNSRSCCSQNSDPEIALPLLTSSSCNSAKPQARRVASIEAIHVNSMKMHTTVSKPRQSESSCKHIGFRIEHQLFSTAY